MHARTFTICELLGFLDSEYFLKHLQIIPNCWTINSGHKTPILISALANVKPKKSLKHGPSCPAPLPFFFSVS